MDSLLRDGDLALVPLGPQYEQFYIKLANDPAIRERVNNETPYLKEHFETLLNGPNRLVWIIEAAGDPVGAMLFAPLRSHPQIWQGGYWIEPAYWGKGYATRAVGLARDYIFVQGAARIQALVEPGNTSSMRVLEKAGFRHEGLLHSFYPSRYRGLLDVHMYAITKAY